MFPYLTWQRMYLISSSIFYCLLMCNEVNMDLNGSMYCEDGVLMCDPLRGFPGEWMGIEDYSVVDIKMFWVKHACGVVALPFLLCLSVWWWYQWGSTRETVSVGVHGLWSFKPSTTRLIKPPTIQGASSWLGLICMHTCYHLQIGRWTYIMEPTHFVS